MCGISYRSQVKIPLVFSPWAELLFYYSMVHHGAMAIDMELYRNRTPAYDGKVCAFCGEAWFTLGELGRVCVDSEGIITGYAGILSCCSCGRRAES
jgi:hypothetical protein